MTDAGVFILQQFAKKFGCRFIHAIGGSNHFGRMGPHQCRGILAQLSHRIFIQSTKPKQRPIGVNTLGIISGSGTAGNLSQRSTSLFAAMTHQHMAGHDPFGQVGT